MSGCSITSFFLRKPNWLNDYIWQDVRKEEPILDEIKPDYHFDFNMCNYQGTIFARLENPAALQREEVAIVLSHMNGARISGLEGYENGKPQKYLDEFYQHTAPYRSLESIPEADRTYSVCRLFLDRLVVDPEDPNGIHLLPTAVLWRLARKNPEDPRFISLERIIALSQGDPELRSRLRYEPGFFSTIIARVYGTEINDSTVPPVLGDPILILRLCHIAAPEVGSTEPYQNTLLIVPASYCQFSICMAFYNADPKNLKHFPEGLVPAYL